MFSLIKKIALSFVFAAAVCFGGSDLKTILKVPGVAALKGNFRNCNVEILLSDKIFSLMYTLDDNIINSVNLDPEQFGIFLNNIISYTKKIQAGTIPEEGSVDNLGNSYATIVVINPKGVYKGTTGVYYNLMADKMLEVFIPSTKYVDKDGDYVCTEQIWGLMLSYDSVKKIIKVLTDVSKSEGT
jgi:hypothetical protein